MTPDAIRQHLEPKLARQTLHPVHPRVEVLWDVPYDITQITIRVGGIVEKVAPEMVTKRLSGRQALIQRETDDPLRSLCEPDEYRLIDLECAKKRRHLPGVPLLLWLSGGIRSAKSYCLARRLSCVQWHTADAWCWAVHDTDVTSTTIQQPLLHQFVPREIREMGSKQTTSARKGVKAENTAYFAYTPGTGFVGSQYYMTWQSHDWRGCADPAACAAGRPCAHVVKTGGRMEFRNSNQDESTMVGQKLVAANPDEKVPSSIVKLIEDRLLQRSADTATPLYLERLDQIIAKLEAGGRADTVDLACIYLGWQLISFTPKWGWTSTVNLIAQGAREYGHYDPRPMVEVAMQQRLSIETDPVRRAALEAKFAGQPWNLGGITSVPRFAQPINPRWLIGYLPTWANAFGGNWPGLVESMQGRTDEDKLVTMFGVARRSQRSLFSYKAERHIEPWDKIAMTGTIYELADPAPGKPWVIKWYLVDALGRKRVVQEWPCPSWEIPSHGMPGLWAVPSEKDKLNGDAGPAQLLRLHWNWSTYTRLIWQGRARLAKKFREREPEGKGIVIVKKLLTWTDRHDWNMDEEFVMPEESLMDKHFAVAPTVNKGREMTILQAMHMEENAIEFTAAEAGSVSAGVQMIENALNKDIFGMPELACVPECENTQFAWATFTLPEFREDTKAIDEACKDFIDPDRYFLVGAPEYVDPTPRKQTGMTFATKL